MKRTLFIILIVIYYHSIIAQTITQSINGVVTDKLTKEPLPFANIMVMGSDPLIGVTSDINGKFILENVPVGRQSIQVSMVGYQTYIFNELLVTSSRGINIEVELEPSFEELAEVVIKVRKDEPINTMTTLSSRQFTVEETERYAGGLNDPARLASAFAGVATPSVSSNGISVRGNSPNGLLWQIEGVEVPNPNHFANLTVVGGGLLTALSNQMMGNSDFLTGAFPAEYGNASSGVFDINLRTGNNKKRQYALQAGIIGVDFSTEGPVFNGGESSYLMNYRNSTMALISPLLPENTGILKYQDLAFKTHFPTHKAGTFTFWGIGALDGQEMAAADTTDWEMDADRDDSETSLYMYASGLSHNILLGANSSLQTTFAATGNGLSHQETRLDYEQNGRPQSKVDNDSWRYTLQTNLIHEFNPRHSNKTGFKYSFLGYQVDINQFQQEAEDLVKMASDKGQSGLIQFYSHSTIRPDTRLSLNVGLHSQLFLLNQKSSVEPRLGLNYQMDSKQNLGLAYGRHSRIEQLPVYFVRKNGQHPNKKLDLMKSSHFVFSYNLKINDHLRLTVEPYYQHLTDVPVGPDSYISTLNFEEELFFNQELVSEGSGRNIGLDLTLERFLNNGFYYLLTASLFDSKYTGADGIERNTRFNRNYVINALAGKEWAVGRSDNNLLSANVRLNYMGGNRKEPINTAASIAAKEVVYQETEGNMAFVSQFDDQPIVSFTVSYRKNKPNHSSIWSLQILNALSTEEFDTDFYNLKTGKTDTKFAGIMVPNLSYKIEF
ncbi:MAG: TonB-dependent receptor [Candidatus Cyclobacteriaceae bacterium M3_2C_046]